MLSIRTECARLAAAAALFAGGIFADEPAVKLEPIPLPQAAAPTSAERVAPQPTPATRPLPPSQPLVMEPATVVEPIPVQPEVMPAIEPPPVAVIAPPVVTTVAPTVVPVRPAPVVHTTHYYYRRFRGDFVPVSVAVVPTHVRVVESISPDPWGHVRGPVPTAIPVVVEERVMVVPRHVPGQPVRNSIRRRWLP